MNTIINPVMNEIEIKKSNMPKLIFEITILKIMAKAEDSVELLENQNAETKNEAFRSEKDNSQINEKNVEINKNLSFSKENYNTINNDIKEKLKKIKNIVDNKFLFVYYTINNLKKL